MMKKIVFFLLFIALFVMSCSTPAEKSIKELEKIVVTVETGSVDTEVEYEQLLENIELWNENYQAVEYTPEQMNEIEGLNMRLTSALTEQFAGHLGAIFSGFMNGLMGGMNGLVNGMHDFVDGMQELVDEIEVMTDDLNDM